MNDLVERLTKEQPIEASLRPEPTVEAFKEAIDRGYVHCKFINTKGGTDLGIRMDEEASDLEQADVEKETGSVKIVGTLILDYVRVRFHGTIELPDLTGAGYLEVLEEVSPGQTESAEVVH